MFNDIKKNKSMLEGAYRKLKSYYYYNKNFIVMREKIADFERDEVVMNNTFDKLAFYICKAKTQNAKEYFTSLINSISYYSIPKKFETAERDVKNKPVSNTIPRDKKMKTVNFFIDMPIELHIIDTLWTILLAKIVYDENILTADVYGNTILESIVSNYNCEYEINFQSNRLFDLYFYKYSDWRNNAFSKLESNYNNNKDSILVSLDLHGFFYAVRFDFSKLKEILNNNIMLKKINTITHIMSDVFRQYKCVIQGLRKDLSQHTKRQMPLPIGLFSSMILSNVYLAKFDQNVTSCNGLSYYGRYVDDLLFVFNKSIDVNDNNEEIIKDTLIMCNVIEKDLSDYILHGFPYLKIQKEKIKLVYLDHSESRSILDIYNNTIRIIPSQIDPIPDLNLNLSYFDESAYCIENFNRESKLRDIGQINIDAYRVSSFFSALIYKYTQINSFNDKYNINITNVEDNINKNILQIEKFFTGCQCIEYYSNWLNYMYFLVISQRYRTLAEFYQKAKKHIQALSFKNIDPVFCKPASINKRTKQFLLKHLEICRWSALALDIKMVNKHFVAQKEKIKSFIASNMFNHNLIAFPLSNYLKYAKDVSLLKMEINDIGEYSKVEDNFKFRWSPRFIHYDELLLLLFYHYHKLNQNNKPYEYIKTDLIKKFVTINHLNYGDNLPFEIDYCLEKEIKFPSSDMPEYILRRICVPIDAFIYPKKINIAVANIKLDLDAVRSMDRWKNISINYKITINEILRETYKHCNEQVKILVLPELSIPIYWINDLIKFAKKTQTAIITGLQYLYDSTGRTYNYIATILPFEVGNLKYRNAFIYIREKNDYSPIEKEELARINRFCKDKDIADYQIFSWNGINVASFVCYELTDVMARALIKGKCDFLTVPVFNKDTTYFSNIIDTTVRDLHAFIVQSNTSIYGDSRVTGPYDRDNKDIFKIKGGENDLTLVGTIDFSKIVEYQTTYYTKQENKIISLKENVKQRSKNGLAEKKVKPNIKPLSARFANNRAKKP